MRPIDRCVSVLTDLKAGEFRDDRGTQVSDDDVERYTGAKQHTNYAARHNDNLYRGKHK